MNKKDRCHKDEHGIQELRELVKCALEVGSSQKSIANDFVEYGICESEVVAKKVVMRIKHDESLDEWMPQIEMLAVKDYLEDTGKAEGIFDKLDEAIEKGAETIFSRAYNWLVSIYNHLKSNYGERSAMIGVTVATVAMLGVGGLILFLFYQFLEFVEGFLPAILIIAIGLIPSLYAKFKNPTRFMRAIYILNGFALVILMFALIAETGTGFAIGIFLWVATLVWAVIPPGETK